MRFFIKKNAEMIHAHTSATVMAHQIPSIPNSSGKMRTDSIWKTKVRRKEIVAEITPLFNAVKKADAKMFKPDKINANEKMRNACVVISNSS